MIDLSNLNCSLRRLLGVSAAVVLLASGCAGGDGGGADVERETGNAKEDQEGEEREGEDSEDEGSEDEDRDGQDPDTTEDDPVDDARRRDSGSSGGPKDGGGDALDGGQAADAGDEPLRDDDAGEAVRDSGADDAAEDAATDPSEQGGPVSVEVRGPYEFKTYTDGLSERTYGSSIMYYPVGVEGMIGGVAFSPGFTATKEDYTYLGELLASHGFAVLLTTPTSTSDQPPARGVDLQAAVAKLKAENSREGSPLEGKLNGKVCITGQSMGGGGTLHGATALKNEIACAVPLQPWQPGASFAGITAPTLFIGAERDTIASVSGNTLPHYRSIPDTVEKVLVEVAGADHFYSTNRNTDHSVEAHVMVAWYKLHLQGDERYRSYLYGDKKRTEGVSRFEASKQ